jgi:hypothetical protein
MDDDDEDVRWRLLDLRDLKRMRVEAIRKARAALGAVEFQLRPDGEGNEFAVEKYTDRLEAAAREFLRDIGRHQEAAAERAERPSQRAERPNQRAERPNQPCKRAETPRVGSAAAAITSKGESSAHARASAGSRAPSAASRPPKNNRRPGKEPMIN